MPSPQLHASIQSKPCNASKAGHAHFAACVLPDSVVPYQCVRHKKDLTGRTVTRSQSTAVSQVSRNINKVATLQQVSTSSLQCLMQAAGTEPEALAWVDNMVDDIMADAYSAMEGADAKAEHAVTISSEVIGDMKVEEGAIAISSNQPTEQMFGGSSNGVLDALMVSCSSSACLLQECGWCMYVMRMSAWQSATGHLVCMHICMHCTQGCAVSIFPCLQDGPKTAHVVICRMALHLSLLPGLAS